ncbi:MAG: TRAP transporter large permease [Aequoribacter sp.]|jgi:tripartite ATP-independent transporter DctM subunit|uniref:TRAP transporter large permease n=1 Tax=Aequoribacter sp. TaxID=2847771 RepID=UPI003C3263B1
MDGSIALLLFGAICALLLFGFPVALTLGGTALLFAAVGIITHTFDANLLAAIPARVFGIMTNETLIAVPLFVMMGVILEKSKIAEDLLVTMSKAFGRHPGGLGLSVVFVGMLLAASTGIVGATVVTMGLLSLPSMLKAKYSPSLAAGTICATGTLGQIIPPSIALVLLGDVMSNAYQRAQLNMGIFNTKTVSVGDLFIAAIGPGVLLVFAYAAYIFIRARINPEVAPAADIEPASMAEVLQSLLPPLVLIGIVLGSILVGAATPTEAAGVGAIGALILALLKQRINKALLQDTLHQTLNVTAMVFLILIGATLFSLVFRGFGGEELIQSALENLPGGAFGAVFVVMLVIFLLGFILDFIEITFVVVPIVGPILLMMGIDPVWLGIMIALNLQTSFLTPPFGFALFYLRGVAPSSLTTGAIYRGVIPFIIIQLAVLALLWAWPPLATYLPSVVSP